MSSDTFLPDDYLAKRTERRTNLICLTLFAVVMVAVFAAFLVTNQAWSQIKEEQEFVNERYTQAGQQIHELTELERQRDEMLHKAELAAALVERVPRSILLAELINRMPEQLGLLEFEIRSEVARPRAAEQPTAQRNRSNARSRNRRAPTVEEENESLKRVEPPRFNVQLTMVGVAPTDIEVTGYLSALNNYSLLDNVTLEYIEQKEVEERRMREFRITMTLETAADVRHINPLQVPRDGLRDPMNATGRFIMEPARQRAGVTNDLTEGN